MIMEKANPPPVTKKTKMETKRRKTFCQTSGRPSSARPCSATFTAVKGEDHPQKAALRQVYEPASQEQSVDGAFKRQSLCRIGERTPLRTTPLKSTPTTTGRRATIKRRRIKVVVVVVDHSCNT